MSLGNPAGACLPPGLPEMLANQKCRTPCVGEQFLVPIGIRGLVLAKGQLLRLDVPGPTVGQAIKCCSRILEPCLIFGVLLSEESTAPSPLGSIALLKYGAGFAIVSLDRLKRGVWNSRCNQLWSGTE
ncbi:MAG: hypothetical protein JW395_3644 [Nitrospira sp.]|nr:hypothetical protein [Nitrospira sp.]